MRGDGHCEKSPEDSEENPGHCIHPRRRARDLVCCWCGDLFLEDDVARGRHGQYRPSAERKRDAQAKGE